MNLSLPTTNPAPDPGEFTADASRAYAAGLQFASALRQATNQQQYQQQQQWFQQQKATQQQQMQLMKMGATKVGGQTTAPGSGNQPMNGLGQTGLQVRPGATGPDPTDQSGNRIMQEPGGPSLTGPAPNVAGTLSDALQAAGQQGIPQTAPPEDLGTHAGHLFTAMDGSVYHIPDLTEREKAKQKPPVPQTDANTYIPTGEQGSLVQGNGVAPGTRFPLQDAWRNASQGGAPHYITGQDAEGNQALFTEDQKTHKLIPVEFPEGYSAGKPDKPAKYTYEHFLDNAGRITHIRHTDAEDDIPQILKGQKWVPEQGGEAVGPTRKDPNAPKATGPKPATPAQLNSIETKKKAELFRAETDYRKAMSAATVGGYTDTEAAAQALEDLHRAKQASQDSYEEKLNQFGLPTEHVEYPAGQPTQQAPPPKAQGTPPPATPPAQAPPAQKPATPEAKPLAPWNRIAKPAPAAQAAPVKSKYPEGTTATGAKGEKLVTKGGQWVPQTSN